MTEQPRPARDGDYGLLRDAADVPRVGSLSSPPIVLRQDRLKLGLCAAGFGVLALGLLGALNLNSTLNALLFVVIAASAIVPGLGAISPATLTLGPDGLVRRSVFRTVAFSWPDVTGFRWYRTRTGVNAVVADHSDSYRASGTSRRFLGATSELGGFWELPVQHVVDELNAALAHWGPRTR